MYESTDVAPAGESKPVQKTPKKKLWLKILLGLIIVLLLVAVGYLAWQWKTCLDQHNQAENDKKALQSKVDDLTKQIEAAKAEAKKNSGSATPAPGTCSPQKEITQNLKDNLADAIKSKNTAALGGYMASSVNVIYAASEKAGAETPAQAISDLDYVNSNAVGPWDFNLPTATLNTYKNGAYKQYFDGVIYVGKASNGFVLAYGFDTCAKINRIFVSASADLLN